MEHITRTRCRVNHKINHGTCSQTKVVEELQVTTTEEAGFPEEEEAGTIAIHGQSAKFVARLVTQLPIATTDMITTIWEPYQIHLRRTNTQLLLPQLKRWETLPGMLTVEPATT